MPSLSEADRSALLQLARNAVVEAVSHGRLPEQVPQHGVFAERRGAFVTLHVQRRLRGGIGVIETDQPLGDSIVRCAASSAGLLVSRGAQRGLLLPQVAVEHHLTREQFFEETCRKAQLACKMWRQPGTQLFGFTCEVFSS